MVTPIRTGNSTPPTNFRQGEVRARQRVETRDAQQQAPATLNRAEQARAVDNRAADNRAAQNSAVRHSDAQRANNRPRQTPQTPPGQTLDTFA